ncbi:hypothetical protein KIN20_021612 [Parelaphostrongylus tenuis]|uniref:Uncharacterized protein n=1 Tax=Parelaphostrongylus tenuis TaxID=148309 RepID=A0AAD5N792_PARTN|nr:hypothetical protein KIN20_021612 [Parelaphostrongylus tenuis]
MRVLWKECNHAVNDAMTSVIEVAEANGRRQTSTASYTVKRWKRTSDRTKERRNTDKREKEKESKKRKEKGDEKMDKMAPKYARIM